MQQFPGLKLNWATEETLTLSDIPKEMNGWRAYCEFTGAGGTAKSGQATTYVTEKTPTPTPTPTPTTDALITPAPIPSGNDVYSGTYVENIAGRGVVSINGTPGSTYYVTITWPGSAFEEAEWTFSGEFDGRGVLEYSNCSKVVTTYDEDGIGHPQEEYSGGSGYIQMNDEGLTWTDSQEGVGADSQFDRQ